MFQSRVRSAASIVSESESPGSEFAAGWLRQIPVAQEIHDLFYHPQPKRRELHRTWHTWLTGLYHYSEIPQDYWYPGGPLGEAMTQLELRDRPVQD
jgi:hypothetical protein